jgi:serine/threonine protein kinase
VKFYSANILLAIEHLHTKKIIHRDIKPENLLINMDGYVNLADFGFAKKLVSDDDKAFTFVGSPLYMAPEGILKKGMNLSGDSWAYAVTLYELLTGQCLFNDPAFPGDLSKIFLRVLTSKNKGIPFKPGFEEKYPKFASLLKKLLGFDSSKRWTMAQARSDEFFEGVDWNALSQLRLPTPYSPKAELEKLPAP